MELQHFLTIWDRDEGLLPDFDIRKWALVRKHGELLPDFDIRKMKIRDRISSLKPGGKQSIQCVWDAGKECFVSEAD